MSIRTPFRSFLTLGGTLFVSLGIGFILEVALFGSTRLKASSPSTTSPSAPSFSWVYQNSHFTGLSLHPKNPPSNTKGTSEELQKHYQLWVQFQKDEMPIDQQKVWIGLCRTAPVSESSPFCPLFLKELRKKVKTLGRSITDPLAFAEAKLKPYDALHAWHSGNYSLLAGRTEAEVMPILRSIQSPALIRTAADHLIKKSQCLSSALFYGIGIKLETFFPHMEDQNRAEALYLLAMNCGSDPTAVAAAYRLALFKISKGQYDAAESVFSKIPKTLDHSSDYRMRIGYWRFFAAQQNQDHLLEAKLRVWMTREYPLSMHSLLTHPSRFASDLQWSSSQDPEIRLRPIDDPNLSLSTAAIEYLLAQGEPRSARILLADNQEEALAQPPSFRLYWAILLKRAKYPAESFRFMASAFRENQKLISRSTLEMLYPKHFAELIPKNLSSLDPFLTLSIIRQESAFDPLAISPARAIGLMQIQFPTARSVNQRITREELWDPAKNIQLGNQYIHRLLAAEGNHIELALAAYNAGPGRVRQWRRRYPTENPLLFVDLLPNRETREYVSSIIRNYYWYSSLYSAEVASRNLASYLSQALSGGGR